MHVHRFRPRAAAEWQLSLERLMQSEDASRSLLAALAFLAWDVLITLDDEAVHIWMTPFQPLKILYLFTRYYSVLALIILNTRTLTCKGWVIIEGTSAVLLEIVVEIILILRIYAMYTANRRLLYVLVPAFVAQVTIMVASLGVSLPQVRDSPHCAEVVFPTEIIAYSISSVAFEGILVALTLCKYFIARAEGWGRAGLMTILVRDGVWAFVLLFVANLANTLFFTIAPATLAALGFPWLLAILGALGPRLILNIRREHKRALPDSLDDIEVELSPITEYAAVDIDESDEINAWSSRLSLASWKSALSSRRSSVPWGTKTV
ncbi:hypothetical protein PsYK624_034700 [Phanerochaete sordida]|uniref:DUF6533 domain-containing protein n=1 Tax=Phanerochaete sordida TaxID=48140 RepID=A0A9P3LB21_9APHY|nr:hypothetical protein PsYK624_034700 [Phanerochaete sordida]